MGLERGGRGQKGLQEGHDFVTSQLQLCGANHPSQGFSALVILCMHACIPPPHTHKTHGQEHLVQSSSPFSLISPVELTATRCGEGRLQKGEGLLFEKWAAAVHRVHTGPPGVCVPPFQQGGASQPQGHTNSPPPHPVSQWRGEGKATAPGNQLGGCGELSQAAASSYARRSQGSACPRQAALRKHSPWAAT